MTDLGEIYMLRVWCIYCEHAPNISVSTVRDQGQSLKEELEMGSGILAKLDYLPQLELVFIPKTVIWQNTFVLMR